MRLFNRAISLSLLMSGISLHAMHNDEKAILNALIIQGLKEKLESLNPTRSEPCPQTTHPEYTLDPEKKQRIDQWVSDSSFNRPSTPSNKVIPKVTE